MTGNLFFLMVMVGLTACKQQEKLAVHFPECNLKKDTVFLKKTGSLLSTIMPLSFHRLTGTGFFTGGSFKNKCLYVFDIRNDTVIDSLCLSAGNSYEMHRTNDSIYLYNATGQQLFHVQYHKRLDTVRVPHLPFGIEKDIYVSNYSGKKMLLKVDTVFCMLYAYGDNNKKPPNFLDRNIFRFSPQVLPDFGSYPGSYFNLKYVYRSVVYDGGSADDLFYCFEMLDELRRVDFRTKSERKNSFSNYAPPKFNMSKAMDLAYKRRYESQAEYNCDLAVIDSNVILLKRLPKQQITDSDTYKILLFNLNLQPVGQISGIKSVAPYIIKNLHSFHLVNPQKNEIYTFYL